MTILVINLYINHNNGTLFFAFYAKIIFIIVQDHLNLKEFLHAIPFDPFIRSLMNQHTFVYYWVNRIIVMHLILVFMAAKPKKSYINR